MLYHWHEIELSAGQTVTDSTLPGTSPPGPIIRYNRNAALAEARGGLCRMHDHPTMSPCNDFKPDPIAERLRQSGLGMIGDPAHRMHRNDNTPARRLAASIAAMWAGARALLSKTNHRLALYWNRTTIAGCSHTIDANGADDLSVSIDDAQRQRFQASKQ